MRLTLSVVRCPPGVPPQTRVVEGGEFSIGRAQNNDWVLPLDPYVSKRHCVLAYRGGDWQIADLSSNGTFVNADPVPIGPTAKRTLHDHDRLRFGEYIAAYCGRHLLCW